jgi:hypothetical protein
MRRQEGCFMKLKIFTVLIFTALVALVPVLAQSKPRVGSTRMRPQLFHDRTPKVRTHDTHLHEVHARPAKSPPPTSAKEEF